MTKETIPFENFLWDVEPRYLGFVNTLHELFLENACTFRIEQKSSGYLVSYIHSPSKKVILNFVFRKKGLIARIYGDHVNEYPAFMNQLPADMVRSVEKAPDCKRLKNPETCNPKCSMGYDFEMGNQHFQKCRYNCFMFTVSEENNPFILSFVENELGKRE